MLYSSRIPATAQCPSCPHHPSPEDLDSMSSLRKMKRTTHLASSYTDNMHGQTQWEDRKAAAGRPELPKGVQWGSIHTPKKETERRHLSAESSMLGLLSQTHLCPHVPVCRAVKRARIARYSRSSSSSSSSCSVFHLCPATDGAGDALAHAD